MRQAAEAKHSPKPRVVSARSEPRAARRLRLNQEFKTARSRCFMRPNPLEVLSQFNEGQICGSLPHRICSVDVTHLEAAKTSRKVVLRFALNPTRKYRERAR